MKKMFYFLPGNRWPWFIAYRYSLSILWTASIVFFCLMGIGWYFLICRPLLHYIHVSQAHVVQLTRSYTQEQQAINTLNTLILTRDQLCNRLCVHDVTKVLSNAALNFLEFVRVQNGVILESFKPGSVVFDGAQAASKVDISFKTNFDGLLKICSYAQKIPVSSCITHLSIVRLESGQLYTQALIEFNVRVTKGIGT